jgi:hypothetical protein
MYSYPITGKHCIHIPSQEKVFYLYPITENYHNYPCNTFSCHGICPIIYSYISIHFSRIPLFKRLKNRNYFYYYFKSNNRNFIDSIFQFPSRKMIIIIHIPSRESIRFICHLRKMFKFTTHHGKFSYSYPVQEIVHVHITSRENKTLLFGPYCGLRR